MPRPRPDLVGQRFGSLVVVSSAGIRRRESGVCVGIWNVRCDCGVEKEATHGSLMSGTCRSCGCARGVKQRGSHRKHLVAYGTAHRRVRDVRGKADTYACVDCGDPARDWSYDHTDPDELTQWVGRGGGMYLLRYSLDIERYVPRCKPCHMRLDIRTKRARLEAS